MNIVSTAIRQPVTVAVGVILVLLAGTVAVGRLPIQLTPNVEDTIIAVTTFWEGASPQEIEQEIVDPQEDKLEGIANLVSMTSESLQSQGKIRLQFQVGISKEDALREVSDKLRQVPDYPENTDEPVIEASDPESRDFIAWIVLNTTANDFDIRTLQDFCEDRVKPVLERVAGMSEVNVLGGREREAQIRFDPRALAQRGITIGELVSTLQSTNRNISAGELPDGKRDIRVRTVSQFDDVGETLDVVLRNTENGPVRVRDVATVVETFKEPRAFVRSRGRPVIAINAQKEIGANVMEVMNGLQSAVMNLNQPGGTLETEAKRLGLPDLKLTQVYDQTIYIDQALALVQSNIWIGGLLAILVLLLFLRSFRSAGIVALAIPISIVGAIVAMVALGRSVNVISLAGMAFAVGMVVDNAIVVLENIHRHLEMGKHPMKAARDGANEVWGAVLAATLTTIVVFIPILMIEEEAGQLFRDIALAICAAVALSLVVSITVIPTTAARILKTKEKKKQATGRLGSIPDKVGSFVERIAARPLIALLVVLGLTSGSYVGTRLLMPPADYLPTGNRNLVFGMMIPPPGYNLEQKTDAGLRVEQTIRPFFEAGLHEPGSPEYREAKANLPAVPIMGRGEVVPPPLENYFLVSFDDILFHGGISHDPKRVADVQGLLQHASRMEVNPGTFGFAFQMPLFRLGGNTGSAVKVQLSGEDLNQVTQSAGALFGALMPAFGPYALKPSPSNFNVPGPELQVRPHSIDLQRLGMNPDELGLAVQTASDGRIIGDYRLPGGETIDLKLVSAEAITESGSRDTAVATLAEIPVATPEGRIVSLGTLADLERVGAPQQINRIARQRSVTIEVTPPPEMPLDAAIGTIEEVVNGLQAGGAIPPTVDVSYAGSASKLTAVKNALLGDGTLAGTMGSSLVLALLVVYLLMCILFQSFVEPFVILISVPVAALGGFLALAIVAYATSLDPYMPDQKLDVLTMLGFVILIGVVVNNAILIVHQALNFMGRNRSLDASADEEPEDAMTPAAAIGASVRSRVRPIFMGMLTSVGGMAPLVVMPGSGSELYRGLGGVVLGGLFVSTIFTLLLVPLLLGLMIELRARLARAIGIARSPTPGVAALWIACLPLLAGCSTGSPRGETSERFRTLVEEVLARETTAAQLGGSDASNAPRSFVAPDAPLPPGLADRVGDLGRLGGDAAYDGRRGELGTNLLGTPTTRDDIRLVDAVRTAVEHSLGVRLARLGPEIAETERTEAEAAFDLEFFSSASFRKTDEPQRVPIIGGVVLGRPNSASEEEVVEAGVRKLLPHGATVTASSRWGRLENDTLGIDFDPDPAYSATLSVGLRQPLLRGSGERFATSAIALADNEESRQKLVLRSEVIALASLVEEAYWQLAVAEQQVLVRERLLEQGEEVHRVLRERGSFDARPAAIADAAATVEERRAALVTARRVLRGASDQLKALIDDPTRPLGGESVLRTVDPLPEAAPPFEASVPRALATALTERPEIEAAILTIDDAELREHVARNLRQPLLDLEAEIGLVGLDEDFADATRSWSADRNVDGLIGVVFEIPFGNRGPKAAERRATLERTSAELALRRTVDLVVEEVKGAMRDVRSEQERLAATRTLRLAQTENLRALLAEEESRAALTPEFLSLKFVRQERLAAARLQEMDARASVRRAIARFRRAVGALPPLPEIRQMLPPREFEDVEVGRPGE